MTGEIEWGERPKLRKHKKTRRCNNNNNNSNKWAPKYTKNVLKRKSTAKIVLSIFRCQKSEENEAIEEAKWRQKRWQSINSSCCAGREGRWVREGRLKVEKWQKSRGDWETGHGFATEEERGGRHGKCWQLLSAFCSCPAGRLETTPAAAAAVQLDSWHPMLGDCPATPLPPFASHVAT